MQDETQRLRNLNTGESMEKLPRGVIGYYSEVSENGGAGGMPPQKSFKGMRS